MIQSSAPLRSLFLLLFAQLGCSGEENLPRAGELSNVSVERPAFDSARAFGYLEHQVAFGPRIPGREGHARQLEWMRSFLAERADTVLEQRFTHTTRAGEILRLTNLFARFRPELEERVLLLAHWDTRPLADQANTAAERNLPVPGANDGASGTAVLLELANLFAESPPPIGVDLLFVDGEDFGPTGEDMYLGAKHFAANLPAGYRPFYGILLDMVADRDPLFTIEGNSRDMAPEVVQRVWDLAREMGYGDLFVDRPGYYIEDDHIPLNRAGIRTIDVIDLDYAPWHTPRDLPENTSAETLGVVGEVMAELVYRGG